MEQIRDKDVRDIIAMLIRKAKKGDLIAAREVLDRSIGKAKQAVEVEVAMEPEVAEQPRTDWEVRALFIEKYALFMVPKRAWIPGVLRWYEIWRDGRTDHRPPNFAELVERVESRCNWIRTAPGAVDKWPNDVFVFDGKELKVDSSTCPCSGIVDG